MTYLVGPGEWICALADLRTWFRCRFHHQAVSIPDYLQKQNYSTYSLLENKRGVKFKITEWPKDNTVLEYNFPCKKDDGFFFFPITKVHELLSMGKCSEMDMLLDMWIHAIYNDPSVQGSYSGPVVYYRNHTGNPVTSFQKDYLERNPIPKDYADIVEKILKGLNRIGYKPRRYKNGGWLEKAGISESSGGSPFS